MKCTRLTANRIEAFACPTDKKQAFLLDTDVRGLAVRVTRTGHKSFIFESKLNNDTIRLTIGDVKTWSIEAAGKEARRLKTLCDIGSDPRVEKVKKIAELHKQKLEQQQSFVTLGEIWTIYIQENRYRWGEHHLDDHNAIVHLGGEKRKRSKKLTVAGVMARLVPLALAELTPERLTQWLKRESAVRPTQTALAFRLLRAFLNWCSEQEQYAEIVHNAYRTKRVRLLVPKSKTKDGCLQREQLKLWFEAIKKINPVISAYCQVMLLTGARRDELIRLKWSDIDFRWKSIKLADKVEDARIIPLTPYVEYLLNGLPKINEWVFSSERSRTGHIVEPRYAFNDALITAGLPHLTIHDLRRSFGTLAEWVECPVGVSAQLMGHKPSALAEKHYRRRPLDLLRVWHEKIESWMLREAGIPFNTEAQLGRLYVIG